MLQALADREVVVIDGGMGTELEARGAPMDDEAWSGLASLDAPELVREIHADYIRAGADVIIANSFATNRPALAAAGREDGFERANRAAVAAAVAAREAVAERPVVVAGSMSLWFTHKEDGTPLPLTEDAVREAFREQADVLARAGAELLILEMLDARWSAARDAALETGLPVWAGLWTELDRDGKLLSPTTDRPFEDDLPGLVGDGLDAVLIMHSPLEAVMPALEAIARHWEGQRGAYPHAGHFERPHWVFEDVAPDALADEAEAWVDAGARLVGGCCGTRPEHIRAIRDRFARGGRLA